MLKTSKNNNFTDKEFSARIRGNFASFDNSAELYLPGKRSCSPRQTACRREAVFQIFTENNQELCFVHNTLSKNLPNLECNKWYHKEDSPYHYFVTKVGSVKLMEIYDQTVVYFRLHYMMVLDWAYCHFLNHHLDTLSAYSNHDWNLKEFQSYAQSSWGIESKDRAEIIKEIKHLVRHTADWVDNLKVDNL